MRFEVRQPVSQFACSAFGAQFGLIDSAFNTGGGIGERMLDLHFHALDAVGEIGEPGFHPALDGLGFTLRQFAFLKHMAGQLAQRLFERFQRFQVFPR